MKVAKTSVEYRWGSARLAAVWRWGLVYMCAGLYICMAQRAPSPPYPPPMGVEGGITPLFWSWKLQEKVSDTSEMIMGAGNRPSKLSKMGYYY